MHKNLYYVIRGLFTLFSVQCECVDGGLKGLADFNKTTCRIKNYIECACTS